MVKERYDRSKEYKSIKEVGNIHNEIPKNMTEQEKREYEKQLLEFAKKHIQTSSDSSKRGLDKYLEIGGKEEPIVKR